MDSTAIGGGKKRSKKSSIKRPKHTTKKTTKKVHRRKVGGTNEPTLEVIKDQARRLGIPLSKGGVRFSKAELIKAINRSG